MGVAAGSIYTLLAPSHTTVLQTRLQSVSDLQDEIYPHTRLLGFCHPWCPACNKAIQETHPCRCTQRFQRQLFRVVKVQGVWTPGDLVPGTLLWREQVCQTKVRPSS